MAHPRAQSLRHGGPLPRLWIDSSPTSHRRSLCSPSSPFSSTHVSAATTLSDTPFSPDAFNVLCLYDYEAADADQLSFRKNEILEIIKREESGWWAAMRPGGYEVGWIPSAYVEAISERVANRPCGTQNSRTSIDELTRAHHPSLSTKHSGPYIATPAGESHGHHWMPLLDEDQARGFCSGCYGAGSLIILDITSSVFGPLVPPHDGVDEFILGPETEPPSMRGMMARLRLPATEMPPPLPAKDSSSIQKHTSSPSTAPIVSDHSRSYSEPGSPAISRHLRRRPVLIDDRGSLSRLSTLFETNNIEELDSLIGSPVIAGSFDAFSRKGGASTKWTDGCEAAPRDHEVPVLQPTPLLLSTRSSYGEHELQTQPGGSVAAGSLRALLDKLTSDSHESAQEKFQRIFLMTFRTFASADEVSYYLIKRYHIGYPIADKHVQEKKAHTTQERVLAIIKMWYEEYGMLQDDSHISSHLMDFTSSVMAPSPLAATAHTISESLLRLTLPKPAIPTSAPTKHKDSKTSKINLFHLDPTHVAEQLCLYEHSLYRQIRPQECLNRVKTTAGDSGITNITAFCSTRHRLVTWVKTSILSTEEVRERAATIDFWIRVAERCRALNNFSTMSALVVALSSHAISQQSLTWTYVSLNTTFDLLIELNEPANNFSSYRLIQRAVDGPCVPLVETYLADIIDIDRRYSDDIVVPSSNIPLINFAKREAWYDSVNAMLRYQAKRYAFAERVTVMDFIETNLAGALGEDLITFSLRGHETQQAELDLIAIGKALDALG